MRRLLGLVEPDALVLPKLNGLEDDADVVVARAERAPIRIEEGRATARRRRVVVVA